MSTFTQTNGTLHHIAIAVWDIQKSSEFFKTLLGLSELYTETIVNQQVKLCMLSARSNMSEYPRYELISPLEGNISLTKFLKNKGEGLHHICFEVENINDAIEEYRSKGAKLLDGYPQIGSQKKKIAFFHPSSTHGTLIEICSTK